MDKPRTITPHLSYWLVPSSPDRAFLQGIINTCAQAYAAPSFEPHVTIYSGPDSPQDDPETRLRQAVRHIQRVRLRIDTLRYSAAFTKTVFVQFHPCPVLSALCDTLRRAAAKPSDYELNPHLSLIYKQMNEETKQHLASSLHLPQAEIVFDEVSIMRSPGSTQTSEDVKNWQVIYRKKLS